MNDVKILFSRQERDEIWPIALPAKENGCAYIQGPKKLLQCSVKELDKETTWIQGIEEGVHGGHDLAKVHSGSQDMCRLLLKFEPWETKIVCQVLTQLLSNILYFRPQNLNENQRISCSNFNKPWVQFHASRTVERSLHLLKSIRFNNQMDILFLPRQCYNHSMRSFQINMFRLLDINFLILGYNFLQHRFHWSMCKRREWGNFNDDIKAPITLYRIALYIGLCFRNPITKQSISVHSCSVRLPPVQPNTLEFYKWKTSFSVSILFKLGA